MFVEAKRLLALMRSGQRQSFPYNVVGGTRESWMHMSVAGDGGPAANLSVHVISEF